MSSKQLRNRIFASHRFVGLAIGSIAIVIGITGSLIVFLKEISEAQRDRQNGGILG